MKNRIHIAAGILFLVAVFCFAPLRAQADEPIIVVIDPGHGGKNLGAEFEEYTEKEMTLTVAKAMYEELSKYDGVEVYLTRKNNGTDISLADRAEFAAAVNADILISLHFNMSENHNLFGSEVWISAFGEKYQEGYALGEAVLKHFDELGIYRRGIKTRLNEDGEDYYGIIREARARDVTAVLVEHCHLDQDNDTEFYNSREKLERFGRLDATATAEYFGLSSELLGKDFSGYEKVMVEMPASAVEPDLTPPDVCMIELVEADKDERKVKVRLSAADYDSRMLYYSYSVDGGETFSDVKEWPGGDTFVFTASVPSGVAPRIVVNGYNQYDRITASNELVVEGFPIVARTQGTEPAESMDSTESVDFGEDAGFLEDASMEEAGEEKRSASGFAMKTWGEKDIAKEKAGFNRSFKNFLVICAVCIGILLALLVIGYSYLGWKKRKRQRRF